MQRRVTIKTLVEDHRSLRSLGDALVARASHLQPGNLRELQDLRWTLTRDAHQHLILDERYVQVLLDNHRVPAVREKAAELREDAELFRAYWTQHIADWPKENVQVRWRAYQMAVRELVARMNARLDREESELYPLMGAGDLSETDRTSRNWAGEALKLRTSLYS